MAFSYAGHGGVKVLLGNEVLGHQGFIALILETGVHQLRLGGAQVGFGLLHLGDGLVPGGDQILILQGGQDLALLDPAAFLHPQVDQAAGALGGNRGLALGHHVAAGVQDRVGLGRVEAGHHRGGDLRRRLEGAPQVEPGESQQDQAQENYDHAGPGGGRRRALFPRALNAEFIEIRRQCQSS